MDEYRLEHAGRSLLELAIGGSPLRQADFSGEASFRMETPLLD